MTSSTPQSTIEALYGKIRQEESFETLYAVFFKTGDDTPRALITGGEWLSNDRCHHWNYYYFAKGKWENGRITTMVESDFSDFYVFSEEAQEPRLIVVSSYGHQTKDWDGDLSPVY